MHHWNLLHHLSGIRVHGPDAKAFAHAQFTTAFTDQTAPGWHPTAWCNPKGRVMAVMLARTGDDVVELIAPAEQSDFLVKRLPMFAIGRKVSIESDLNVAGCLTHSKEPHHQLDLDPERGIDLEQADAFEDAQMAKRWVGRDICAGLAWLSSARSEQFLPQALGLEERGGLSYQKGCYPGQEVVARVHYLGRAKERLSGFKFNCALEARDQDLLDQQGNRVGKVLESLTSDSTTIGLAVVGMADLAASEIFCGTHQGRLCEPSELC